VCGNRRIKISGKTAHQMEREAGNKNLVSTNMNREEWGKEETFDPGQHIMSCKAVGDDHDLDDVKR
jgi:hypothetical protein